MLANNTSNHCRDPSLLLGLPPCLQVLFWEGDFIARSFGLRFLETSVVAEDCVTHAFCATAFDVINRMPLPTQQLRLRQSLPVKEDTSGAGPLPLSRASKADARWNSPLDSVLASSSSSSSDLLDPRGICSCCCL